MRMKISLVLMPLWTRETPSLALASLASNIKEQNVSRHDFNLEFNNHKWRKALG